MSPAALAEMQPDLQYDQLQAVGKAFDALLLTVYRLTHRQNELFQHMDNVFKEVNTHFFFFFFLLFSLRLLCLK
jgi:hypothetical protein